MAETLAPQYIVNASFDPWAQEITVLAPDGRTPLTFQYSAIMLVQNTAVYQSISTGLQVGASLILLLILLLITNKEKRRSVVYLLNSLALLIIVIRGIIMFVAITGPFFDFYRWISKYYTGLRDAKDLSISGEILTFMLVTTIEISLALQVRIVCCNLASLQQLAVNIINSLVVIVVCGIRFALMVVDIFWSIDGIEQETIAQFELTSRLASAANITLVISIGISTAIFCAKLAFAIESRRSMGMTQFGPMQIIFIMGCQTMVTPLVITIIAYWGLKDVHAQLGTFPMTIVALSLPLSAMWATANTANRQAASERNNIHRQIPAGRADFAKGKAYKSYSDTTASGTLVGDDDNSALSSPNRKTGFNGMERDLEMQEVGHGGVQVDRSYSVRCD